MTGASVGSLQLEIEGQGKPIFFIHGLGGTSNTFQAMLGGLSGFRCIRLDLPGSGRSPRPYQNLTIEFMAGAVIDVLSVVAGGPAHLVAHSLGTLVAQHIAAQAPERVLSLSLFSPIVEPADSARQRLRDRAQLARQEGMIGVADAVAAAGLSSSTKANSPVTSAFVRESYMRQDAEGFAQSCEALANAKGADLRLIRCPVFVATGDEDGVAPPSVAQALVDKLKGARIKIFERCGHWTPVERPKECGSLTVEFMKAREA